MKQLEKRIEEKELEIESARKYLLSLYTEIEELKEIRLMQRVLNGL